MKIPQSNINYLEVSSSLSFIVSKDYSIEKNGTSAKKIVGARWSQSHKGYLLYGIQFSDAWHLTLQSRVLEF